MNTYTITTRVGADRSFTEDVNADYLIHQNGALLLKRAGQHGGYPEIVKIFAPGHWLEVYVARRDQ